MKSRRAIGDTAKFIKVDDSLRVGGYLVRFTDKDTPDLQGEFFDKDTNFWLESNPIKGKPIFIDHMFDTKMGAIPVGVLDFIKEDNVGLWVEGKLKERKEYEEMLEKWNQKGYIKLSAHDVTKLATNLTTAVKTFFGTGKAQWSSGAVPQSVEVSDVEDSDSKHIDSWMFIEGTGVMTPAEPNGTQIGLKQAFIELDKIFTDIQSLAPRKDASNGHKDAKADDDSNIIDNVDNEGIKMNEQEIRELIRIILEEMQGDSEKMEDEDEALAAVDVAKMEDEELDDESKTAEITKSVIAFVEGKRVARETAQSQARKAARDANIKFARNQKGDTSKLGGFSADDPNKEDARKATPISVGEMRKFANLTGSDMALGVKMLVSGLPHTQRNRVILGDLVSDGYARTMAQKLAAEFESNPLKDPVANYNVKSVLPFKNMKADEFNASDITAQGIEWVTTAYDEQLWERVRDETTLFDLLQSKGMRVVDIPQGAQSVQVQTDTASGSVFYRAEANDLSSNVPEVTAVSTAYGTGNVTLTAKEHVLAYFVTDVLQEDSILDSLKFANQDMITTLAEALEDALINGDTTSDTTNINHDGAALTAAPQRELWRVWEGIRHNFLIDNTSLRADHSTAALAASTFLSTRNLLPGRFRNRRQNLLFLMDYATEAKARQIAELFTRDVAYNDATLFTGILPPIDGVEVYTSGFLRSADTDGKITDAGNTTETGTLACVYAPYWAYARKRQVSVEAVRGDHSVLAGGTQLVATVRHDFSARGANASSGTFNILS